MLGKVFERSDLVTLCLDLVAFLVIKQITSFALIYCLLVAALVYFKKKFLLFFLN
jgi:hypothetical protein